MRTGVNLAVQLAALATSVAVRWRWGGLETILFVIAVVPPLLMLVPTVVAVGVYRRRRLEREISVPFIAMAGSMVVASVLMPCDGLVGHLYIPLFELLAVSAEEQAPWIGFATVVAVCGILVFLAGLVSALVGIRKPKAEASILDGPGQHK